MPSRVIRESALTSPSLNKLSHGAERLWWRLTVVADDHGRFDCDPQVLRATCFPLKDESHLPLEEMRGWITELVKVGGIRRYRVKNRIFGYFIHWQDYQRVYGLKSKYPDPPQIPANCGKVRDNPGKSRLYTIYDMRESISDIREGASQSKKQETVQYSIATGFTVPPPILATLARLYPDLNVPAEIASASQYYVGNGTTIFRPRARLTNWLRIAQAHPERRAPAALAPPVAITKKDNVRTEWWERGAQNGEGPDDEADPARGGGSGIPESS